MNMLIGSPSSSGAILLATVRDHWSIENALHRQLDVSFQEDAARNRKDNAPGNIAVLRRCVLDVVRQDKSKSGATHRPLCCRA